MGVKSFVPMDDVDFKVCPRCNTNKPIEEFSPKKRIHKDHDTKGHMLRRKTTTLRLRLCKPCVSDRQREWHLNNPGYNTFKGTARLRRLRDEVINGYGHRCVCCGESTRQFLTLDHVHGGGGKHRRESSSAYPHYEDAYKREFPDDYRLLCYNCNCSRAHSGKCPHEGIMKDQRFVCPCGEPQGSVKPSWVQYPSPCVCPACQTDCTQALNNWFRNLIFSS